MQQNKKVKRIISGAIIFIAAALILQLAAMLFMSSGGLLRLYPYILAISSDKIDTADKNLGEYYPLHAEIENSGIIVLAADLGVSDTYVLAGDFLRFLGKFTELSCVAVYINQLNINQISAGISSGDHDRFLSACELYSSSAALSDQMISFAGDIFDVNSTLKPDLRMSFCGIKGYKNVLEASAPLISDLMVVPGGYSGAHIELTCTRDEEEYVRLFRENEESLKACLGSKFEYHEKICSAIENGTLEESTAFDRLLSKAPPDGRTVYAVLPEYLCEDESPFMDMLREAYGNVSVIHVKYFNCSTEYGSETTENKDDRFPGIFNGIRIASADALSSFRKYYASVVSGHGYEPDDKMSAIGEAGASSFFIISGSGAVTYSARDTANETGYGSEGGVTDAYS